LSALIEKILSLIRDGSFFSLLVIQVSEGAVADLFILVGRGDGALVGIGYQSLRDAAEVLDGMTAGRDPMRELLL